MKKMRIITIIVTLFLCTGMSIISVDLFTKSQIDVIADDVFTLYTEGEVGEAWGDVVIDGEIRMNNNFWYATAKKCECNENELNFGLLQLLNINPIHTGRHYAHYDPVTKERYSWSWQDPLYEKPEILFNVLDNYGYYFIRSIDAKFNYAKKNNTKNNCTECLSSDIFWNKVITMIDRYQLLIEKFLLLDEREFDYYFMTYGTDEGILDLNTWIESQGIQVSEDTNLWGEYSGFPHDYLYLLERTCSSSKKWNARKFLEQTQEFNKRVIKLINETHQ